MNPGIYTDLSNVDYHAETDWIGSSQLKGFLPEYFKPFNGSTAADLGSILHQRFTGEDVPVRVVDAATWAGKAAKEEYEAAQAAGEYAILAKELPLVDGMEQAARDHKVANKLLTGFGTWETSVFAEVNGVPSKCRFDRIAGSTHAVDIKSTKAGPGAYSIAKTVIEYGYDMSMAHYLAVAEAADIYFDTFSLLYIPRVPPHHVTVVTLDEPFLERGRALRDLALQRFLHPSMVDAYPGESEPIELSLPGWARIS